MRTTNTTIWLRRRALVRESIERQHDAGTPDGLCREARAPVPWRG